MTKVEVKVDGMSCGHCVKAVTKAIQAHDASAEVMIDLEAKNVSVYSALTPEVIRTAIAGAGYEPL